MSDQEKQITHFAYCAIIGEPNAGKSTLMRALLGVQISAISAKPQTTRRNIIGVLTNESVQIAFFDTPGMLVGRNKSLFHSRITQFAKQALEDSDILIYVMHPWSELQNNEEILFAIAKYKKNHPNAKILIAITKIDLLVRSNQLQEFMDTVELWCTTYNVKHSGIIPISLLEGKEVGCQYLKEKLLDLAADSALESPFHYDSDKVTPHSNATIATELVQEQLMNALHQEVPHAAAVMVQKVSKNNNMIHIDALIITERDAHKQMIIGKQGRRLKHIGTIARRKLEDYIGSQIVLKLWVKTIPKWRDRQHLLGELGY